MTNDLTFDDVILYYMAEMLVHYYTGSDILIGWLEMLLLHFWGSKF